MDLFVFFFSSHFWRLIKSVVCMLVYSSSSLGFLFPVILGLFSSRFFRGPFFIHSSSFSFFLSFPFLSLSFCAWQKSADLEVAYAAAAAAVAYWLLGGAGCCCCCCCLRCSSSGHRCWRSRTAPRRRAPRCPARAQLCLSHL